jgi:hypothetical protein
MNKDNKEQPKNQPGKTDQPASSTTKNGDPKNVAPTQSPATGDKKNPASTTNLATGDKKVGLISIDNYDPSKGQQINSPRSLKAMKFHGVELKDLKPLKSKEELQQMFDLTIKEEAEDFKRWEEKNRLHYENLKKKIAEKRKELILEEEDEKKKKLEFEQLKKKQLKILEEEKKTAKKEFELEMKKREHELKKIQERIKRVRPDESSKTARKEKSLAKSADKKDARKPTATDPKDKKAPTSNPKVTNSQVLPPINPAESAKGSKKRPKSSSGKEEKKPIIFETDVKERGLFGYLDNSTTHKDLLELGLKQMGKKDLEKEKERIRDLMEKQKKEILELAQKRTQSAYKTHDMFENVKTRKIEYLADLTRDPVQLMKEKQQKEMESMMNFEIGLQVASLELRT